MPTVCFCDLVLCPRPAVTGCGVAMTATRSRNRSDTGVRPGVPAGTRPDVSAGARSTIDAGARTGPVLDWYAVHARDLPWRTPDASPWGILVSEIMLQQTPVA